jgi:hypothetical protein
MLPTAVSTNAGAAAVVTAASDVHTGWHSRDVAMCVEVLVIMRIAQTYHSVCRWCKKGRKKKARKSKKEKNSVLGN